VQAERITELDWSETVQVAGQPARRARSLPCPRGTFPPQRVQPVRDAVASFVLRGSGAGGADTPFTLARIRVVEGFAEIGAAYGPFDLTLLEIGAYNQLWKAIHMGPDGAAQAFQDMGGAGC